VEVGALALQRADLLRRLALGSTSSSRERGASSASIVRALGQGVMVAPGRQLELLAGREGGACRPPAC
jgi:hypothetical protein